MFRTSNPALKNESFQPAQTWQDLEQQGRAVVPEAAPSPASALTASGEKVMTMSGTVNKTLLLLCLCIATATVTWMLATQGQGGTALMLTIGGALGGLVLGLVCAFKPKTAPITAPLYALAQGLFVGGVSAIFSGVFDGGKPGATAINSALVANACVLTFGIAGGVLLAYRTGLIRPGRMFYNVVTAGTIGVGLYALVAMGLSFFGNSTLISVYDPNNGGLISIGFSLLLVVLASANLVLDFDMIANGVRNRAPRYMEWYGGYALLVTLVWLYIEVLRLLSKLQSRD